MKTLVICCALVFATASGGWAADYTVTIPDANVAALEAYLSRGDSPQTVEAWLQELVDNQLPANVSAGRDLQVETECAKLDAAGKAAVVAALGTDPCE